MGFLIKNSIGVVVSVFYGFGKYTAFLPKINKMCPQESRAKWLNGVCD